MNISTIQIGGAVMVVVLGGVTAGQYAIKRRNLRGVAFGYWCERRFALMFLLTALACYLPELWRELRLALPSVFNY